MFELGHKKFVHMAITIGLLGLPCLSATKYSVTGLLIESSPGAKSSALISPETVQGCYELGILQWRPGMPGEDAVFMTPPRRIQLLAEPGTQGWEKDHYPVRPAPGFPASIHRASFWTPTGSNTIEIVWTTGFSGVTMKLKLEGETLKGKAKAFWDFPRSGQSAHIVAPKIDCNKASDSH